MRKLGLTLFVCFVCSYIFPQDIEIEPESPAAETEEVSESYGKDGKPYVAAAIGEMLFSNAALVLFNRFVLKKDYAMISFDSMYKNLTNKWVWDQDEFSVNHIGHPYQGSFYYTAARSNGLNPWWSFLNTVAGSITWELFCETETPSMNDLIVTTMGGFSLGEMLHRLSSSKQIPNPGNILVGPFNAINGLWQKRTFENPRERGEILYTDVSFSTGVFNTSDYFFNSKRRAQNELLPFSIGGGLDLVYGNPFGNKVETPYDQFELSLKADLARDYYAVFFNSDGILWSLAPDWGKNVYTTAGFGLHYDFIFGKRINLSANSIGLTLKQIMPINKTWFFSHSTHLNYLVMGASDYYYFRSGEIPKPITGEERRDYDLGTGFNFKTSLNFLKPNWGNFGLSSVLYGMTTISSSVPEKGSGGFTLININSVDFDYKLTEKISTGVSWIIYNKWGFYDTAENVGQYSSYFTLFLKYRLI